jgi:hypothetical protein
MRVWGRRPRPEEYESQFETASIGLLLIVRRADRAAGNCPALDDQQTERSRTCRGNDGITGIGFTGDNCRMERVHWRPGGQSQHVGNILFDVMVDRSALSEEALPALRQLAYPICE